MGSWRSWVLPLESLHLSLFSTLATTSERKCRERERDQELKEEEEGGGGEGRRRCLCIYVYVYWVGLFDRWRGWWLWWWRWRWVWWSFGCEEGHSISCFVTEENKGGGRKRQAFLVLQKIQSHSCKHSPPLESLSFNPLGCICEKKGIDSSRSPALFVCVSFLLFLSLSLWPHRALCSSSTWVFLLSYFPLVFLVFLFFILSLEMYLWSGFGFYLFLFLF